MRTPAEDPARRRRTGSVVMVTLAMVAGLAACGSGGAGDPAAPPAASEDAGGAGPTSEGCAPTGDGPPGGAEPREVADVDGDDENDSAWLTGGDQRRLGITTASGATFSVPLGSASPERAAAVVDRVATEDGTAPVALVDTGRAVRLFSVAGCGLTPTRNQEGVPYTFDKGFTGQGTGVECADEVPTVDGDRDADRLHLAALNAEASDDGSVFTVTRTFVDLSAGATRATDGVEETVVEGAPADDAVVAAAQRTSCGDRVAGEDGPVEPAP